MPSCRPRPPSEAAIPEPVAHARASRQRPARPLPAPREHAPPCARCGVPRCPFPLAPRSFLSSTSRAGPSLNTLRQQRTALRLDRAQPALGAGGEPSGPRARAPLRATSASLPPAGSASGAGQWSAATMADAESFLQATLARASGTPAGAPQRSQLAPATSGGPSLPRLGSKAGTETSGARTRAGGKSSTSSSSASRGSSRADGASRGWGGHPPGSGSAATAAAPPRPGSSSFTDDWRAVSPMEAAPGSGAGLRAGCPPHQGLAPERGHRAASGAGPGSGAGSRERLHSAGPDGDLAGLALHRGAPPRAGAGSSRGSLGLSAPGPAYAELGGAAGDGAGGGSRLAPGLHRTRSGTSTGPDGRFRGSVRSSTMTGSAASLVRSASRRGRAGGVGGALSANPLAGRAAPAGAVAASRRRAASRTGTKRRGRGGGSGRGRARTRDTQLTANRRQARDDFEGLSAFGEGLDEADYDYEPEPRFRTRLVAAGLVRPGSGGGPAGWDASAGGSGVPGPAGAETRDGRLDGGGPGDDGAAGGHAGASDRARAMDDMLSAVARGDEAARLRQQLHASRAAASHAAEAIRAGTLDLVGGPAAGGGEAGGGGYGGAAAPPSQGRLPATSHGPVGAAGAAPAAKAMAMRLGPGGSGVPPLAIGGRAAARRSSQGGQLPSLGLGRHPPSRSVSMAEADHFPSRDDAHAASRAALRPLSDPAAPGGHPGGDAGPLPAHAGAEAANPAPLAPSDAAAQDCIASLEAEMAQDSGLASWASKLQGQVASSQSPSARGPARMGSQAESEREASPSRGVSKQLEAMRALRERLSRVAGVALP